MKRPIHIIKKHRIFRRFDRLLFWKLRKARFAVLILFCFWLTVAENAVSKGQEPVLENTQPLIGRGSSEGAYTNFENSAGNVALESVGTLPLQKSHVGKDINDAHERIRAFMDEIALFFEANGKRGDSIHMYMSGLTQFYKIAELYRSMTLSERNMIKDAFAGNTKIMPLVSYLDAFSAVNQDAFLRVLAEMFAQENPKLIGKTMKTQDVELMLQVVRLGKQDTNTNAGTHESSLCTDPHLSATST